MAGWSSRLVRTIKLLFEPRYHQTWNDLEQVTKGYLSWFIRTMHSDYMIHILALVALVARMWLVSVYEELK